jgi:hypothetical protein
MILLYTTIGGSVGAAITQYVTHIRDRRAARALVLENINKVEIAYAALKPTIRDNFVELSYSSVDELLGALEATGMIAGVPRCYLQLYMSSIKINCEYRRMEAIADGITRRGIEGAITLSDTKYLEPVKMMEDLREVVRISKRVQEIARERPEEMRRFALSLLNVALWHPWAAQFVKRRVSRLKSDIGQIDEMYRLLDIANTKLEGKTDLTSYLARFLDDQSFRELVIAKYKR